MNRLDVAELGPKANRLESGEAGHLATPERAMVVSGAAVRGTVASDAVALWTIEEVSAYLRVPVGTIYQWRVRGEGPPAFRLGGRHLRFSPESVRAWALAQPAA